MLQLNDAQRMVFVFVVAFAIFEIGREVRESTPHLAEIRDADEGDTKVLQHLVDGQAQTGILVGGAALVAWWACRDIVPALIIAGVYGALVWYQHSVRRAPATV